MATATASKLTTRGAQTRRRIVAAAADLIFARGVAGTTLEDVREAAQVSSSQIYHYFADKQALVRAVIAFQTDVIIAGQPQLGALDTMAGLQAWRNVLLDHQRRLKYTGGCPLGSLASEVADVDDLARAALASAFSRWEDGIREGLRAMHVRGEFVHETDPDALSLALLSAVQGGILLTQVQRDPAPLQTTLDTMLAHIASLRGEGRCSAGAVPRASL